MRRRCCWLPRKSEGYAIDPAELERRITPKTKALIINSPSNPTGATYGRRMLERIAAIAIRHHLVVISDEIYEKVLYDGASHVSIASLGPEIAGRTVVINGVSKAYAMTGWRIGYAAGPKDLITAMGNIQSQSTSNPCSISQKAAVAALRFGEPFTKQMVTEFDRRRRVIVEGLNAIPGVSCSMPGGAFYAFPNIQGVLGQARSDRSGQLTDGPRDLSPQERADRSRAGRTVWQRESHSPLVCHEHGHDHERIEAAAGSAGEAEVTTEKDRLPSHPRRTTCADL